jgi:phosphofructokinase-like protein
MKKKRIGILTCGGDCPGLNAAIRAIVKTAANNYGREVIGFRDGYKGLVYNNFTKLGPMDVSGLLDRGGTILGTTNNFDPFSVPVDKDGDKQSRDLSGRVAENIRMHDIECLIVIGGTTSINIAYRLVQKGINIVVIPKTIDNDVPMTDVTFGFMTAVNTVTQALDKLHSTAESHHRAMILEVMGRNTGWVSLEAGIAGGADIILIPEIPYDVNIVARKILERKNAGKTFSIIIAAEGSRAAGEAEAEHNDYADSGKQHFDGVGNRLATRLEEIMDVDVKVTVLGYLQRGGEPSPYDRILTTRMGALAAGLAAEGKYNVMAAIRNDQLCPVSLSEVAGKIKRVPVDGELVGIARSTGISFGD